MNMATQIRHFLLTPDGRLREFSAQEAALVAAGTESLPEFAGRRLRYLQVTVNRDDSEDQINIQAAGACITFDDEGRLSEAGAPEQEQDKISHFEYDACVAWVLKNLPSKPVTFH
jgi:hypothetical protein